MSLLLNPDMRRYIKGQIATEEGFRQFPYLDTTNHWTIGFGRNLTAKGISRDEALVLLENDMLEAEHEIWKNCPWYAGLSDVRKVVVLDMVFNLGMEGFLKFHGMIAAIKDEDWAGAAEHMRHSLWETQVGKRADRLADMMESNVLP